MRRPGIRSNSQLGQSLAHVLASSRHVRPARRISRRSRGLLHRRRPYSAPSWRKVSHFRLTAFWLRRQDSRRGYRRRLQCLRPIGLPQHMDLQTRCRDSDAPRSPATVRPTQLIVLFPFSAGFLPLGRRYELGVNTRIRYGDLLKKVRSLPVWRTTSQGKCLAPVPYTTSP